MERPKCVASGKRCLTKREAQTLRNVRYRSRLKSNRIKLRIYQCPQCNFWHLTKQV